MRVGGTVYNNLKGGGGTEKRGEKTQILKRAGKLNQGVGALKKGAGILINYVHLHLKTSLKQTAISLSQKHLL